MTGIPSAGHQLDCHRPVSLLLRRLPRHHQPGDIKGKKERPNEQDDPIRRHRRQ